MKKIDIGLLLLDADSIHLGILLQRYKREDLENDPIPYIGVSLSIGFLFGSLHIHFIEEELD